MVNIIILFIILECTRLVDGNGSGANIGAEVL